MAITVNITGFMDMTSQNLTEIYHSWRWSSISSNGCHITEDANITLQYFFPPAKKLYLVGKGSQSFKRNVKLFRLPLTSGYNTFYLTLLRSSFCCVPQTCVFLNNDAVLELICASCYCCSGIRGMCSIISAGKKVGYTKLRCSNLVQTIYTNTFMHTCIRTYVCT